MLETVAAAPISDEFSFHCGRFKGDPAPEQYVEILKRDCGRVMPGDAVERGQRRGARTEIVDAGKIGVEIDGVGGWH